MSCPHRFYERKTRLRQPIVPSRLKHTDGRLTGIYNTLKCTDIHDLSKCKLPPLSVLAAGGGGGMGGEARAPETVTSRGDNKLLKFEHTEQTLLPMMHQSRRVTVTMATTGGRR